MDFGPGVLVAVAPLSTLGTLLGRVGGLRWQMAIDGLVSLDKPTSWAAIHDTGGVRIHLRRRTPGAPIGKPGA